MGDFIDGDCGGPSAPITLASHFTRDKGFKDEGFHLGMPQPEVTSNQLVNEFLDESLSDVSSPFHMGALLNQMHAIEQGPKPFQAEDSFQWTQEFNHGMIHSLPPHILEQEFAPSPWVNEFKTHEQAKFPLVNEHEIISQQESSHAFRNAATEFLEMADEENDVKLLNTEFADFMKKVASGEVSSPEHVRSGLFSEVMGKENEAETAQQWANQFSQESGVMNREENWQDEFNGTEKEFWDKMASQWEKISNREYDPWLSDFYEYSKLHKDYNFSTDNPMENMVNALDEGQKRLQKGDLPGAVLCFEAAVKQTPDNAIAWQLLGTTQAENEQDIQAIAALNKCISLDTNNLTALMALAVSYTNESYQNQACKALKEWIRVNPSYSDLIRNHLYDEERIIRSIMSKELYDEVKGLFLQAARRNPQESIDADVQTGLSVLFNLSGEPDRAADCCQAALSVRPDDWRLWNRLGATLANGGRSEEAVDAYRNALRLSPGFIRARYNLGISCVHLKAYREAAEHLLTALNQQVSATGLHGEPSSMSDTIWTTLRLVISLLERADLMPDVNNRDLMKLNEAFNIN